MDVTISHDPFAPEGPQATPAGVSEPPASKDAASIGPENAAGSEPQDAPEPQEEPDELSAR